MIEQLIINAIFAHFLYYHFALFFRNIINVLIKHIDNLI